MAQRSRLLSRARLGVRRQLERLGWRTSVPLPEEQRYLQVSHDPRIPLPRGAAKALRDNCPRLRELRQQYAALAWPVSRHTFWAPETVARDVQMPWFRGDNAFVWQYRQLGHDAARKIAAVADYVASRDRLGLLGRLKEDGLFGCWTFELPGHGCVSRDLLDSVSELNFLERTLNLSRRPQLRVVDIGAGYGRLAHRMCMAFPNVERYDCLDAVPEATFLCEYYLRFRGLEGRARAVPLPDVDSALPGSRYDLALNIHSFSECTYDGIRWWLQRLRVAAVPRLLIIPNHWDELRSAELDGSYRDYAPLLDEAGYRLSLKEPVFDDAPLREEIGVRDHFMLYELHP